MFERLALWGLTPGKIREDIVLPGSPERCVERGCVEDATGAVWMMEKLYPGQMDRRERIGRSLAILANAGLAIPSYRPDSAGRYATEVDGQFWQISPFVLGDPLPQPEFVEEAERGASLGTFVAELHRAGVGVREFDQLPPFLIEEYINGLMGTIELRHPRVHEVLLPVLPALAPLFDAWNELPVALCQGDFHPLNVIWQNQQVGAVIDWEFMGLRPALFDVANCLGCVGIEEPRALVRGLAVGLLSSLRDEGALDETSLSLLPELVVAMRFAWMSEWLRKQDTEMIDIELRFLRLLTNSLDTLVPAWNQILER
jgi:homoserine kinase type II